MITSLSWVPRGAAQKSPVRFELSLEELEEVRRAKEERVVKDTGGGGEMNLKELVSVKDKFGLPADLMMEEYGDEHDEVLWEMRNEDLDEEEDHGGAKGGEEVEKLDSDDNDEMENDLAKIENDEKEKGGKENEEEPETAQHEDLHQMLLEEDEEDEGFGSDAEDFDLKETDKMLVCASTEEDFSNLEVYVYDEENGSLFVHHDIPLPTFPLCTSWIGCGKEIFGPQVTTNSKNYIAVGSFKPLIEIWNLDVIDVLQATVTLGDENGATSGSHGDAVLGLDWNKLQQQLLVSASADKTVKLWDLNGQNCLRTYDHHNDKVQSAVWNPLEPAIILTGSFDRSLGVLDAKSADSANVLRFQLDSDVECSMWNLHHPEQILASTEDGRITCFDVRKPSEAPLFSLQAHARKPCSSISIHPHVKGMLASCSPDKSVKIWDLECSDSPKKVAEKVMSIGPIFDVAFDIDSSFFLAAGGESSLALWNVADESSVANAFQGRVPKHLQSHFEDALSPKADTAEAKESQKASLQKKKKKKKKNTNFR